MMTPEQLRVFLSTWDQAWRQADVWRATVGPRLDPKDVAHAYLHHIACPAEPLETLLRLIDEGAFEAADALLANDSFRGTIGERLRAEGDRIQLELDRKRIVAHAD